MSNVKEINIKNRMQHFLDNMIKIKNLDLCKIKIDKNSFKNIYIYCIGYKIKCSAKSLYVVINKINGYIKENNENNYLTLLTTDESKETLKTIKNYGAKVRFVRTSLKPRKL